MGSDPLEVVCHQDRRFFSLLSRTADWTETVEIKKTAPESELTFLGLNDNPKQYHNVIEVDVASKKLDLHQSSRSSNQTKRPLS